jgi:hypothetical protein
MTTLTELLSVLRYQVDAWRYQACHADNAAVNHAVAVCADQLAAICDAVDVDNSTDHTSHPVAAYSDVGSTTEYERSQGTPHHSSPKEDIV